MALEALTVGTLKARIHHALANVATVDSNLDTELGWHINAVMRDMVTRTQRPEFRVEATLATVASQKDYAMPDAFYAIIDGTVRHDSDDYAPLSFYDQEEYDKRCLGITPGTEGKPRLYTLRNRDATTGLWQLRLSPIPDAVYTLRYWYFSIPTNCSTAVDATQIDMRFPREFAHGIVEGVITKFPNYLTPQQLVDAQRKYEDVLTAMGNAINPVVGVITAQKGYMGSMMGHGRATWPNRITGSVHP